MFRAIFLVLLTAGCAARHTWVPGPSAQVTDFEMQSARCRLGAQGGVVVNTYPQSGAAAIGAAAGAANNRQNNFNDCMIATGWRAVD